eukprot:GHVS01105709.1.p3 GENE.GHVS01105709.1~~GHVS01105709.1.p3  ORF type:complete len:129 (-),score=33.95 GHVS01105709.1:2176-2562(-)
MCTPHDVSAISTVKGKKTLEKGKKNMSNRVVSGSLLPKPPPPPQAATGGGDERKLWSDWFGLLMASAMLPAIGSLMAADQPIDAVPPTPLSSLLLLSPSVIDFPWLSTRRVAQFWDSEAAGAVPNLHC